MKNQKNLQYYSKNYFIDIINNGLDPESSLFEIFTRIDEFYDMLDSYLQRLENRFVISKNIRKEFLQKSFQMLYDDIYLNAIIAIEGLDLGNDLINDENKLINNIRSDLKKIEKIVLEYLKPVELVVFTPLQIEYVGLLSRKNKNTKRQKFKKPGRPKLITL